MASKTPVGVLRPIFFKAGSHCREAFMKLNIFTLLSLYNFEVVLYSKLTNNQLSVSTLINTRFKTQFTIAHQTQLFEKLPLYIGNKVLQALPQVSLAVSL